MELNVMLAVRYLHNKQSSPGKKQICATSVHNVCIHVLTQADMNHFMSCSVYIFYHHVRHNPYLMMLHTSVDIYNYTLRTLREKKPEQIWEISE